MLFLIALGLLGLQFLDLWLLILFLEVNTWGEVIGMGFKRWLRNN